MNKKILVVDDEILSIKAITDCLNSAGYLVETTDHGEKAWQLLQKNPDDYAIIFADRMMFGVDGMELLRRMKEHPKLKYIPFIMQTGEADMEEFIDAMAAGVFEFIYKPIECKLLLYSIQNAWHEYLKINK